jgi:hypothetical protein
MGNSVGDELGNGTSAGALPHQHEGVVQQLPPRQRCRSQYPRQYRRSQPLRSPTSMKLWSHSFRPVSGVTASTPASTAAPSPCAPPPA